MLFLDFETRSTVDLRKVGVYNYAHHPSTEIVCTGWAVDNEPATVTPGLPPWLSVIIANADCIVAHNAGFEREMLRGVGMEAAFIPWGRWRDTAAMAARMSLPRKLEHLAEALHLDQQKDMTGHRVMLRLARPKKGYDKDVADGEDEFWEEEERPEDFATLRDYCRQDVEVMRECYRRLLPLEPTEARLYALTGRMNDEGVGVDLDAIPGALDLLAASSAAGEARFKVLTGGPGLRSYAKAAKALGLPNMQKPTVRRALQTGEDERTQEALTIFTRLARSSPAKLKALQRRASADGRIRGSLIYAGAERTTRWSSGGVQLHNLPRGMGEATDRAFEALGVGAVDLLYDDPIGTVADMLRGFFLEDEGLLVGDFAQIEARALAWMAGQQDLVTAFAKGEDTYSMMASRIYGRTISKKKDPAERFMGKVVTLGCGFGMGWEKFQTFCSDVHDIDLSVDEAMRIIGTYRQVNNRIVAWWDRLGKAFEYTVRQKAARVQVDSRIVMGTTEVGGVHYAWIQLPGGRRLWYAEPAMTDKGVEYWGRNIYKGGKWDRVGTWGGKLAENITQATARDVMADAMLRLDAAGFGLLLTVHDEVVAVDNGDVAGYKSILMTPPGWASGLPIDVEIFQSRRYRK